MIVGKVTGRVISTRKHDKLIGSKFLVCEVIDGQKVGAKRIVAVDTVGAGIGEIVMIVKGCGARASVNNMNAPVDAAIIGILDDENDLGAFDE